jgi:hypothetical protein
MRAIAVIAAALLLGIPAASARSTVNPVAGATHAVNAALTRERAALDALNKQPPNFSEANNQAYLSLLVLDIAIKDIRKAPAANELTSGVANGLEDDLYEIKDHDHSALSAIHKKDAKAARAALLAAINAKQHLITELNDHGGTTESKTCTQEKPFDVFAVPAGYAGAYADVFPHGVPKNAKNMKVTFIDLATGKAPAAELFPGQTWKSKVVGFLPDGRLHVHIDVSGTGIGKPDENSKHWKVVVTYDC